MIITTENEIKSKFQKLNTVQNMHSKLKNYTKKFCFGFLFEKCIEIKIKKVSIWIIFEKVMTKKPKTVFF